MSDLCWTSARRLAGAIADGSLSAVEVMEAHLDRIAAVDGDIHAFLHLNAAALETAAAVDAQRAAGEKLGPLAGVPIVLKDNLCTRGVVTTCSSRILEGWQPPYTATVVDRVLAELAEHFDALPEVQEAFAASSTPELSLASVDGDEAQALKAEAWELDSLADRGYFNEKLDQLLIDVLLGVR